MKININKDCEHLFQVSRSSMRSLLAHLPPPENHHSLHGGIIRSDFLAPSALWMLPESMAPSQSHSLNLCCFLFMHFPTSFHTGKKHYLATKVTSKMKFKVNMKVHQEAVYLFLVLSNKNIKKETPLGLSFKIPDSQGRLQTTCRGHIPD